MPTRGYMHSLLASKFTIDQASERHGRWSPSYKLLGRLLTFTIPSSLGFSEGAFAKQRHSAAASTLYRNR